MKILVFDNYDSFTYNLVHLVEKIMHQKVEVYRNDQIPLEKVKEYDKIILSPVPVFLKKQDCLLPLIKEYASPNLYWVFVWVTRQLVKHLVESW